MKNDLIPSSWEMSVSDAKANQERVKSFLVTSDLDLAHVKYALAVGVSFSERTQEAVAVAAPMLLTGALMSGDPIVAREISDFPYVAGLFVYREGPAVCKLLESLPGLPPLIVFDSQGIAHPRGLGMAAHIGVLYDVPTLGLTRKRLSGAYRDLVEQDKATAPLVNKNDKVVGLAVRFKSRCEPVFGSPGHRTSVRTLSDYCSGIRRIRGCMPEGLAIVHQEANKLARAE